LAKKIHQCLITITITITLKKKIKRVGDLIVNVCMHCLYCGVEAFFFFFFSGHWTFLFNSTASFYVWLLVFRSIIFISILNTSCNYFHVILLFVLSYFYFILSYFIQINFIFYISNVEVGVWWLFCRLLIHVFDS
jgi:hypothetical protein